MPTIEEQLVKVYDVIDQLEQVQNELRTSIDNALYSLKGETDDDE